MSQFVSAGPERVITGKGCLACLRETWKSTPRQSCLACLAPAHPTHPSTAIPPESSRQHGLTLTLTPTLSSREHGVPVNMEAKPPAGEKLAHRQLTLATPTLERSHEQRTRKKKIEVENRRRESERLSLSRALPSVAHPAAAAARKIPRIFKKKQKNAPAARSCPTASSWRWTRPPPSRSRW